MSKKEKNTPIETPPSNEELLEKIAQLEAEKQELQLELQEAEKIIEEQGKALEQSTPKEVSAGPRVVTHDGQRYAFRYPAFLINGKKIRAEEATPAQIAALVERKSAVLRKIN